MTHSHVSRSVVHYSGHVQGVGFRYSAMEVAREFDVSGIVCNLPDGRVYLEVEGAKSEVDDYLRQLANRMDGYIRTTDRIDEIGFRLHAGFSIR
ncbi:acylphosphatase [Opitutales bacterium ASA1]|uniref:acylphosphatase n=1 Tax=Congregicoccus parvus TaxID=3081749 RepID=UPI002B3043FC|nr:acylphosphatase [Opitutales bacterium ASA1]